MPKKHEYKLLDYEFGMLVQSLRKKTELTQTELASMIGVSKRTIVNWESGSSYPQNTRLRNLIEVFLARGCFTPNEEIAEAEFLWEKATPVKTDIKDAFSPDWFYKLLEREPATGLSLYSLKELAHQDWSEAADNHALYGRENELEALENWIIGDRQRVITVLGLGGIGKTSLTISVAHQLVTHFDFVIFRNLRNAPSLKKLLDSILRVLLEGKLSDLPSLPHEKITMLMEFLIRSRCLLVLDNFETILQEGLEAGQYLKEFADYGELIRRICETSHQSCLLITSREKPYQLGFYEGKNGKVSSINLSGLDQKSCQAVLNNVNINSTEEQGAVLTKIYGGNPLALKLIAEPIRDIFEGNIDTFLTNDGPRFGGIQDILDQHFKRLSSIEQSIMYLLVLGCEPLDLPVIQNQLQGQLHISQQNIVDGVKALLKRCLLEIVGQKTGPAFFLQEVVMEYITAKIVNRLYFEIIEQKLDLLCRYPLLQTNSREYIRQSQLNTVIKPLLAQCLTGFDGLEKLISKFKQLLAYLGTLPKEAQGYAGGNLLNLLTQLITGFSEWNFAKLNLWQANLAGVDLQGVSFKEADLRKVNFTEANLSVYSLAYNCDGSKLALGCANGMIKVWQVENLFGSQVLFCLDHTNVVGSLAFSPDGSILASGSMDGTVRIWELVRGSCLAILNEAIGSIYSVAFSPDGNLLAFGGEDGKIYLYHTSTLQLIRVIPTKQGWVMSVAFSPDGQTLASGGFDSTINMWDISSLFKKEVVIPVGVVHTLKGHQQWVSKIAFSPNGKLLASCSADNTVRLWEWENQSKQINIYEGHTGTIIDLAFSPDGEWLASGSTDTTIRLTKVNSPEIQKTVIAGSSAISALAFSPRGESLVSACGETSTVKLWSTKNLEELDSLQGYVDIIYTMALSPNGKWLIGSGGDFRLLVWNISRFDSPSHFVLKGHTGLICSLACSSDNQTLASGSGDGTIKLWHLDSGQCLRTLYGHRKTVMGIAFIPGYQLLVSADEEGILKLWSLITGKNLTSLSAHRGRIRGFALSPDGKTLVTGGDDGYINLWCIDPEKASIQPLNSWCGQTQLVMTLIFSKDGTKLFSGGSDGVLRSWDLQNQECVSWVGAHKGLIWSLSLSQERDPKSLKLYSAGEDGFIRVWQADATNKLLMINTLEQGSKVSAIVNSPDASLLVSAGKGSFIKMWDLNSNTLKLTLPALPPYHGLNISGATGLTGAQRNNLIELGAIEES